MSAETLTMHQRQCLPCEVYTDRWRPGLVVLGTVNAAGLPSVTVMIWQNGREFTPVNENVGLRWVRPSRPDDRG